MPAEVHHHHLTPACAPALFTHTSPRLSSSTAAPLQSLPSHSPQSPPSLPAFFCTGSELRSGNGVELNKITHFGTRNLRFKKVGH